jgi:hypothetical protein
VVGAGGAPDEKKPPGGAGGFQGILRSGRGLPSPCAGALREPEIKRKTGVGHGVFDLKRLEYCGPV